MIVAKKNVTDRMILVLLSNSCSVDGQYLNYDHEPLRTTDFTGLCAAMLKLQVPDKKIGKHSSVSEKW